VVIGLPGLSWGLRTLQSPTSPVLANASDAHSHWSSVSSDTDSSWRPTFPGADQQRRLAYNNDAGETVEVFEVGYRTQRQGAELVGSGSTVTGNGLKLRSEDVVAAGSGAYRESEVEDREGTRSLIWSRYEVAGRDFVRPLASQLWYGFNATVRSPSAALIAYRAKCRTVSDCEDARRVLRNFIAAGVN